jgi:hypothetical protein
LSDLRQQDHELLRELIRAGRQGVRVDKTYCSSAIWLALHGMARMTTDNPQRVIITRQGEAFYRRDAA